MVEKYLVTVLLKVEYMSQNSYLKPLHPISGVLENVVKQLGIANSYHGWLVVANWSQLVGEHIAKVAKAYRFEDGILYVSVSNDTWRQELTMQTETILQKIKQSSYGNVVKKIRLVGNRKGI